MSRLRWVRCNGKCDSKHLCRYAEVQLLDLDEVKPYIHYCKKANLVRVGKLERILLNY